MFIVMEVQVFTDGAMSTPCYAYDNQNSAEAKYHSILSSAAVSKLPKHAAFLLTDDAAVIESRVYYHEPEPTEATE